MPLPPTAQVGSTPYKGWAHLHGGHSPFSPQLKTNFAPPCPSLPPLLAVVTAMSQRGLRWRPFGFSWVPNAFLLVYIADREKKVWRQYGFSAAATLATLNNVHLHFVMCTELHFHYEVYTGHSKCSLAQTKHIMLHFVMCTALHFSL